jgi:uncharacterized protein (TIGR03435 family)
MWIHALVLDKGGSRLNPARSDEKPGIERHEANEAKIIRFRNTTMPEIAAALMESLVGAGGPSAPLSVVDRTGLEGGFDFTLEWNEKGVPEGPLPPDSSPRTGLLEALHRVGLALELRKAPVDYLVVDKIDPRPTI